MIPTTDERVEFLADLVPVCIKRIQQWSTDGALTKLWEVSSPQIPFGVCAADLGEALRVARIAWARRGYLGMLVALTTPDTLKREHPTGEPPDG